VQFRSKKVFNHTVVLFWQNFSHFTHFHRRKEWSSCKQHTAPYCYLRWMERSLIISWGWCLAQ
jgi:hypothetical protein